jgi:hypothetical protein
MAAVRQRATRPTSGGPFAPRPPYCYRVTAVKEGLRPRQAVIGLMAAAAISTGCAGSNEGVPTHPPPDQDAVVGISVKTPPGWDKVPVRLPGADVPLEIASAPVHGVVTSICSPGRRILDQIPSRGALVQLLDHGARRDRGFPPLSNPFRLGRPKSYECGPVYNSFFSVGARRFQLRVWPASRDSDTPWKRTIPSASVRHQIEAIVNGRRVAP